MKFSVSQYKIDWPNHIIGFFSALFGILIAFELEEWRDKKNQIEIARIAFENLKKEVQINQNSLHENVANNIRHINTLQELLSKMDNQLRFTGSKVEADSINQNFSHVVFIEWSDIVHANVYNWSFCFTFRHRITPFNKNHMAKILIDRIRFHL